MADKNVLIFRTAKHPVVLQCIDYIKEKYSDCRIFLCVQEECVETYKNINNVKIIKFPNGFFNYSNTIKNKKLSALLYKLPIDMVFIPYNTEKPECPEVIKIVAKYLRIRKINYFDRFKIVKSEYLLFNILKLKLEKFINKISSRIELMLLRFIYTMHVRR